MKAKTLKRMSKRFISSLLSVLMVVSLFTVCAVGSSITAGAYNLSSNITVNVDISNTGWSQVYFYMGYNGGIYKEKMNAGTNGKYSLTVNKNTYNTTVGKTDGYYEGFFFADGDYSVGTDFHKAYHDIIGDTSRSLDGSGNESYYKETLLSSEYTVTTKVINKTMTADISDTGTDGSIWSNVYLYVGHTSGVVVYPMTEDADGNYVATIGDEAFEGYFLAETDISPTGTLDEAYAAIATTSKSLSSSGALRPASGSEIPTDVFEVKISDYLSVATSYLDATMFNYRTNNQTTSTSDGKNPLSTNLFDMYEVDTHNGMADNVKNGKMYSNYNDAVSTYFQNSTPTPAGSNFIPLYVGNFHDLSSNTSYPKGLYHWVLVANGANRKGSDGGSNIHSSAQGLVDAKLSNMTDLKKGVPHQYGIELPQFSDKFTEDNPTLQSKYSNLKFEVTAKKKMNGNVWYSYNSSTDYNRSLELTTSRANDINGYIKNNNKNVHGYTNESYGTGSNGYFPFNPSQPSTKNDLINGHGTRFDLEFVMPNRNGKVNNEALQFSFSGDDDLWVFIDGHLALDLGGSHSEAKGSINLATRESTITTGTYTIDYANMSQSDRESNAISYDSGTQVQPFSDDLNTALNDTTKEHTMSIFYMERGQYNSNLKFEFMLPQTDALTIEQKIDTENVNAGLVKETLNTADLDVFEVVLQSDSPSVTEAEGNPTAEIPVVEDFKRVDAEGAYSLLQKGAGLTDDAKGDRFINSSTTGGYSTAKGTTFVWADTNKSADGSLASVGTGTGRVGENGGVDLLYNQSATFNDQFTLGSNIKLDASDNLKTFAIGQASETAPPGVLASDRTVSEYYTQSTPTIRDEHNTEIALDENNSFKFGAIEDANAKITAIYTNTVKTGDVKFKKNIIDGTDPGSTKFYFDVEFSNIFGGTSEGFDTYAIEYSIIDANGVESSTTNTYDPNTGIALSANETAVIRGIPVGTSYRITETSVSNNQKYYVGSVTNAGSTQGAILNDSIIEITGGVEATVGTTVTGDANVTDLSFNNTSETTTVVYRFYDRRVVSGLVTDLEDHYTYFTRELPGNLTVADKDKIIRYSPTIKNPLKEYAIEENNILTKTLDQDTDFADPDGDNSDGKDDDKYPAGVTAGKTVLLATYTPTDRLYTVEYTCRDASGKLVTGTVAPKDPSDPDKKLKGYPFNGLVELDELTTAKSYTDDQNNVHEFRYWAKVLNQGSGAESSYVPVSTNYNYSYRVTENTVLKAVYSGEEGFVQLDPPKSVDSAAYNVGGDESGYDASITQRFYDSYTKTTSTGATQNRTRINIGFISVGSEDTDRNIKYVGYLLIKNKGGYAKDNVFSEENILKQIKEANGSLTQIVGDDGKTYDVQLRYYAIENHMTYEPKTDENGNVEWTPSEYIQNTTGITLTNKNRVNFVFDLNNTAASQANYFTCYTLMAREDKEYNADGTVVMEDGEAKTKLYNYVSNTPAYFNLTEAEPFIQDTTSSDNAHSIVVYTKNQDGEDDKKAGLVTTSKSTVKDRQKLVITVKPTSYNVNDVPMQSTLTSLKIGKIVITQDQFASYGISPTGESKYAIVFDSATHLPENTKALEITATFNVVENKKDVLVNTSTVNCTNGTILVSADGTNYGATAIVEKGKNFFVKAVPVDGYRLKSWSDTSKSGEIIELTVDANGLYSIPTPTFEVIPATPQHTLTVKASEGGTVTCTYGNTTKNVAAGDSLPITVDENTVVTLTANPTDGYNFTGWSDGETDSTYAYTVTSTTEITANFAVDDKLTFYLKTNSDWEKDGARFALHMFKSGVSEKVWVSMNKVTVNGVEYYSAQVDKTYKEWTIIFCRMNPATSENNWDNKWNQTGDLSYSDRKDNNCFTLESGSWSNGSWSTINP